MGWARRPLADSGLVGATPGDVDVALCEVVRDDVPFGLIYEAYEGDEHVMLEPNDVMFHPALGQRGVLEMSEAAEQSDEADEASPAPLLGRSAGSCPRRTISDAGTPSQPIAGVRRTRFGGIRG
jgi:hypothetical protein